MKFSKTLLSVVVTSALLSACGGGSESTDSSSASSTTMGRVSGFGSVIANGVHYDVDGAAVTSDGLSITEADLKVGMIVRVKGQNNGDGTGTASSLSFDDGLQGTVSSVDLANDVKIEVEGQLDANGILVAQEISFEQESQLNDQYLNLEKLLSGQWVEVDAYQAADGSLTADGVFQGFRRQFALAGFMHVIEVALGAKS